MTKVVKRATYHGSLTISRESTTEMSPSAERLAEATLGSWQAVADAAHHRAREDGRRLAIKDYDLSIEEMSQRLAGELDVAEVEQLEAYQQTAKPRLLAETVGSHPSLMVVTRRRKSG
jgi:hypothetical protein